MAKTRHSNPAQSTPPPIKKKAKEKSSAPQEPNKAQEKVAEIQHICRTCLEEIQASSLIPLNDFSSNIRNELRVCIPEVDFDLVPNAGMCTFCLNALHVAYEFKQKCLQTEDKIRKQLHRKLLVDLTKLKRTSNILEVTTGGGLGLDVVYINDPIEIIDGDIEGVNPFVTYSKSPISTPLLDEEIQIINSSVNNEDQHNKYLDNDDDSIDEDLSVDSESTDTNQKKKSNLLLGLSESAPRKPPIDNSTPNQKKAKQKDSAEPPMKKAKVVAGVSPDVPPKKPHKKLHVCVPECKFETYKLVEYKHHIKECKKANKKPTKQNKYQCTTCKFSTPVQMIFKKHKQSCKDTSAKQATKVPKLKLTLKTKDKGLKVVASKKSEVLTSTKTDEMKTIISELFGDINEYRCRYCGRVINDSNKLEAHVLSEHASNVPYSCKDPNCNFIARVKSALLAHMTQHYGDRPFRCAKCTYQSKTDSALQLHIKRHATSKIKKWRRKY